MPLKLEFSFLSPLPLAFQCFLSVLTSYLVPPITPQEEVNQVSPPKDVIAGKLMNQGGADGANQAKPTQ